MKSGVLYFFLLVIGIMIGVGGMYLFNRDNPSDASFSDDQTAAIDKLEIEKNKTKKKVPKKITQPTSSVETKEDTLVVLDSLELDTLIIRDTLSYLEGEEEYLDIVSERLIAKRSITIQVIQPDSLDASEMLNLKADSYSKSVVVEFWESPLDLIGYELNRSRLKLFGFNSEEMVELKRDYNSEKLKVLIGNSANSVVLLLEKSPKFKSLILK